MLVSFAEMDLRVHDDELRRGHTCVAWRSETPGRVYYSFAANQADSNLAGNARLKLEADNGETGVFTRLDPGSTKAALVAMQGLGNYLSTKV